MGSDTVLQEAIRDELRRASRAGSLRVDRAAALVSDLRERRRRLLDLHYAGKISEDLFAEQEAELTRQLGEAEALQGQDIESDKASEMFEEVARHLAKLDIEEIWREATELERWAIASDLIDELAIYPDHLEVQVSGVPRMNVTLGEVGLTGGSPFYGVGERTRTSTGL